MANTIISWHDKASDRNNNGGSLGTYRSASVTIGSDYFCATDITFEVINQLPIFILMFGYVLDNQV